MQKRAVALIGLGPHAQRIYYPYLTQLVTQDKNSSFDLLIDLDVNKHKTERFLKSQSIKPKHIVYLESKDQINPKIISPVASHAIEKYGINRVILSTEPKAHKIYLEECIKRSIPTVVDKPVTVPIFATTKSKLGKYRQAERIYKDVKDLADRVDQTPGARVLVECQRRNHGGYQVVKDTVRDIVLSFGVPVSFIQIHHSDGMWNMPDEFALRENHPYKYGYGKLMHSGYHFADLLISLVGINEGLEGMMPDTADIFTQTVTPADQHYTLSDAVYKNFFGQQKADYLKQFKNNPSVREYGEVDSFSQMQFTRLGKVITTAQLSLMQSGFSRRSWAELPEDIYKGNGRVRHEFVNIHIGALGAVQVHSYQAREVSEQNGHPYDPGDTNHFDIYIYRNAKLIGGEPFEIVRYGGFESMQHRGDGRYLGHNESARYKTLDELMYDLPSNSELSTHLATNKLLTMMYKNHIKQDYGKIPYSKCAYKELKNE
jgi:predicted dehydrogenase